MQKYKCIMKLYILHIRVEIRIKSNIIFERSRVGRALVVQILYLYSLDDKYG